MDCCKVYSFCHFINLRKGTYFIAIVCLVFEGLSLIMNSMLAWFLTVQHSNAGYIYVKRFLVFLFMLSICYKLLLCVALLVGWSKRLPDHLEMWYKGYLLCTVFQTTIVIILSIKEFDGKNIWSWLVIIEMIIVIIASLYFVLVVRSYFFKMCKESNYQQNIIHETKGQIRPKSHTYEELPATPTTKNITKGKDLEAAQYGFSKKGDGGVVYSAPQEMYPIAMPLAMPLPMRPIFENNDKQSSMLYPSLGTPVVEWTLP